MSVAWTLGRIYMGMPAQLLTRARAYGRERVPERGGLVLAINHMHWIDVPLVGALSPRDVDFVAKVEAVRFPVLGRFILWHGTIAVRRGESDRDAVRAMRRSVSQGRTLGVFVEGTRQDTGAPGKAQPGAAMVAIQEQVPVVPAVIYGTQFWKIGNFAPCSVSFGHPIDFSGLPKNGRGYKEATAEIEHSINRIFEWSAELHARGRPAGATPP